jgi:hypothetical protein
MKTNRCDKEIEMERNGLAETTFGIGTALTGLGVLTFALAPLALPILILTLASLVPLLAVGVAVAIPIALIAGAVMAIRAIGRHGRPSAARPADRRRPAGLRVAAPRSGA